MEDPITTINDGSSLGYVQTNLASDSYRSFRVRMCKLCKFSATSAKEFLQHQISAHTDLEIHHCNKCDFESSSYKDLINHRRAEHRISSSSSRNQTFSMDSIDEANNNEKILARDKLPSPMLPPGDYEHHHMNGRRGNHIPDGASDAIEVFECGLCSFATTKASDLKAHQIKHKIDHIYKFSHQEQNGFRSEVDNDFEIMQRSYTANNGARDGYVAREDDEENRLIIDENLPKTMVVSQPSKPLMTIARPIPVYSTPPHPVVQRAKPGPKPGTTGSANRPRTGCAPVREAVDPAKYITIQEPDGIKYACSKCGNIYKWRKSLNKHWKEKHDGEIPDPRPNLTALNIPRLGKGYVTGLPNGKGNVISFMGPQQQHGSRAPAGKSSTGGPGPVFMSGGDMSMNSSEIRKVLKRPAMAEAFSVSGSSKGMSVSQTTMAKGGSMMKYASTGALQGISPVQPHKMTRLSYDGSLPRYLSGSPASPACYSKYRSPERITKSEMTSSGHLRRETTPIDLSKQQLNFSTTESPRPAHGEGILDLSRKSPEILHAGYKPIKLDLDQPAPQDEPLDFSMKPKRETTRNLKKEMEGFVYVNEEIGSLSLQCPSCAYSAHNKRDYDSHMELHLRKQHYKCAECQEVFITLETLNNHFIHTHTEVIQHKLINISKDGGLKQCNNPESTQLYKYLTMDSQNQLLSCMVCGAIFQWQWTLAKHFEQDHEMLPNPYKKKPSSSATSAMELMSAVRSVSISPSLSDDEASVDMKLDDFASSQCSKCSFKTTSSSEMARHQLKHSVSRQYICHVCSYMTRWKDQLINHYKQEHPTSTIDLSSIISHTVTGPVPQSDGEMIPPSSKPYIDLTDDETTIVYPQAPEETDYDDNHSKGSHDDSKRHPDDSPGSSTSTELLLPFKCTVCEYRARWPSEITQHMKNHSDHKPYLCPRCSYRSKWKWDVVKHLKRCGGGTVNDVIDTTKQMRSHNVQSLLAEGSPPSHGKSVNQQRELLSNGPPNVTVLPPGKQTDSTCLDLSKMSDYDSLNMSYGSDGSKSPMSEQAHYSEINSVSPEPDPNNQAYHVCLHCPFVGNSPAELKRHSRVHSDEKPFICKTCGYCSKWKCDLKKHLRTYKHTSAIPLTYGGHGRKPSDWRDQKTSQGELNTDPEDNDVESKSTDDDQSSQKADQPPLYKCDKCQYVSYKRNFMESHMKIHRKNASVNQAAKLKCKQCAFEAPDLPSFLQHKLTHSQGGESPQTVESEHGTTESSPSTKHRRKASKQNHITRPDTEDDMEAADEDEEMNLNFAKMEEHNDDNSMAIDFSQKTQTVGTISPLVQDLTVTKPGPGKSLLCSHCPYTTDNENSYAKHVKFHNNSKKYICEWCNWSSDRLNSLYYHAQTIHPMELAHQEKDTSLHGKVHGKPQSDCMPKNYADDADVKYDTEDTADEEVTTARRMSWSKRQDMSNIEKRRLEVRRESGGVEDELPPEFRSKRRRRLKTCQKCGYITDNVTTLQRHMAKHGSKGKFTCNYCDYSVDRQHIVEYHIKIVHQPGMKPADGDVDAQSEEAVDGSVGYEEHEEIEEDMEHEAYDDGDLKNHEILWEITKIKGHEMKVQRIGRKTTYHCLKCPLYTCNITNATNHVKQHGAKKKYTCELCDYSLDQLRHVMHHMKKVHRCSSELSFSDNGEDMDDSFNELYNMASSKEKSMEMEHVPKHHSNQLAITKKGIMQKTGHTRYPCFKCSFVAHGAASLRKHATVHRRFGNKFKCDKCDYKATTSRLLLTHCNMHHTQEN